jgi:hypothetical protein
MSRAVETGDANETRRRLWLPWRYDRRHHVESAILSAIIHVALLLLFMSFTFGPGKNLIGDGMAGLGEASVALSEQSERQLDARDLLKQVTIEPAAVPETQRAAQPLPVLPSLGAPLASSAKLRNVSARFSATGGLGQLSGEFGSIVGKLRKTGLDVVLVVDATGSMQQVLKELTARMTSFTRTLQRLVPVARVGAVAFRDRDDDEYVTRTADLTRNPAKVRDFLAGLKAAGGGDWEDGVKEGLESAIGSLAWASGAKKVVVLVGSSPPHDEDLPAVLSLVSNFKARGGIVSTIDITQRLHEEHHRFIHRSIHGTEPTEFPPQPEHHLKVKEVFAEIARAGGGEVASGSFEEKLAEQILVFTFGSKWKNEIQSFGGGSQG